MEVTIILNRQRFLWAGSQNRQIRKDMERKECKSLPRCSAPTQPSNQLRHYLGDSLDMQKLAVAILLPAKAENGDKMESDKIDVFMLSKNKNYSF